MSHSGPFRDRARRACTRVGHAGHLPRRLRAMAWEWAPPLATVVVGVAGVTGTWLAGRNQGQIALESARLGGESSRILAGEERHQRRIETSYQNLDRNLSVVHKLIGRLVSTKTSGPEVTIKEMPPDFLAPSVFDPLDLDRLYRSPLV